MTTKPSVTIITVTYNSSKVLISMLATVPKGVSVVVVDNASNDESVVIAEKFGATVIRNKENVGFARACNMGAAVANSEFYFFLNPDTILNENTVDQLIQGAIRYPSAAAFNPRLKKASGENCKLRLGSIILPQPQFMPVSHPGHDCEIVTLHGAALFISKQSFDRVGGYDEALFFGWEDDDISFRLQLKCGPLMSIYSASIVHLISQSSPKTHEIAKLRLYHQKRGRLHLNKKYGIKFSIIGELCWAIMKVLNGKLIFSESHRIKYIARLSAVWSVIKSKSVDFTN